MPPRMSALTALLCFVPVSIATAQTGAPAAPADAALEALYDSARIAWQDGRYPDALRSLERLLRTAGSDPFVEPVALLTGELHRTVELTADGLAPRWSGDGRFIAYETGTGRDRVTHMIALDGGQPRPLAQVTGWGLAFARDGSSAAYVSLDSARVIERDLATGRETERTPPGVTPGRLVFGADGILYLLGGVPGQEALDRVVRLTGAGAPSVVRSEPAPAGLTGMQALAGSRLLVFAGRDRFAVLDAESGRVLSYDGGAPSPSADGRHIAFVGTDGEQNAVFTIDVAAGGDPVVVHRTELPVASPAVSPDGARVVFQMMPREDWELYLAAPGGPEPVRITREIQHDVFPRFLSNDRVLAVMGEARHRRSHLYELAPDRAAERARLFHNNTIRTVAPEYEWVPSPDGTKVLIVAERDGDTVSPQRGVYLTDLTQRVTRDDLLARIGTELAGETRLREHGARVFAPIAPAVRDATAEVSTSRIYGYARDLFQFDSKFITEPGNQKAIEYIAAKLRSWGYEPELQWFDARGVRSANVIAKLPGTVDPELIYVVSSHFDSVQRGPGADDNSSGTTALLEAARVLKSMPQPATIHFAFFTGEEAGLLGSREYVRRAVANGDRIAGALNNDMVGYANDQRLDNTIRYSNDGIRDIQHGAAIGFTNLITYDAKYYKSTDAAAYYEAYGDIVGGIGSYPILGNPHYHQAHDVLETIDQQLVAEVSKTTVATLMLLASSPARLKDLQVTRRGGDAEARWTPAPETDVTEYVVAYGPAEEPQRTTLRVREPRASLEGVEAGYVVSVKAVNERGMESWDWAKADVP